MKQELIGTPHFSILLSLPSLIFYSFPWLRPTAVLPPPVQERLGLTIKAHVLLSFSARTILFLSLSIPIFYSLWSPSEVLSLFTFVLTAQDIFKRRSCSALFHFVSSLFPSPSQSLYPCSSTCTNLSGFRRSSITISLLYILFSYSLSLDVSLKGTIDFWQRDFAYLLALKKWLIVLYERVEQRRRVSGVDRWWMMTLEGFAWRWRRGL